jgi:hypothetical protein
MRHDSELMIEGGRWHGPADLALVDSQLTDVDFSGRVFDVFTAEGSIFQSCDFRRTRFHAGSFAIARQSVYRDCIFEASDLRHIELDQARFERCTFDQALIDDWASDAAEFIDSRFATTLRQCRFAGRPWGPWEERDRLQPLRTRNEFRGNDFRFATVIDCSFVYGIDVTDQRWPGGEDYVLLDRWPARLESARSKLADWPDDHERTEATLLLRTYSEAGFEEQDALFACRWDVIDERPLAEKVWRLLESQLG